MNKQEVMAKAIAKLSKEELKAIFPPIERKNFVVRKSWLGRNQVITFKNNKGQTMTYKIQIKDWNGRYGTRLITFRSEGHKANYIGSINRSPYTKLIGLERQE